MSLLVDVVSVLRAEAVPHAMIGAAAMSAHGVSRATADVDLLISDRRYLTPESWATLVATSAVDVRRGDDDDPLAGVVRFTRPGELDVDVVVARRAWQHECLLRAAESTVDGIPVVTAADLILLKLYAGGPQDAWDVRQILDLPGEDLRPVVEDRLAALPKDATTLWRTITSTAR
jgi:hypothetical protein